MKESILFQNQPAFQLFDGSDRVIVSAARGARILRWTHNGREVITWPEEVDWANVIKVKAGNPILFPFTARHFVDGKKDFWRDAAGTVRPMPQHGFARDAAFAVVEDGDPAALRMRLTDSEATRPFYPFAFQFDVVVRLRENARLEIAFETTNRGNAPLPYYPGHHFYFALPHGERAAWTLHLPCAALGTQAIPEGSILRQPGTDRDFSVGDPALIDRFQIGPTDPQIVLRHQPSGRRLVLDLGVPGSVPWYAVTTWAQTPESDYYCIEPWLGLPNAIHHGEGLRRLAPGATETAICGLDASGW